MNTVTDLLNAVENIRPILAADAKQADADRKLTPRAYQAMYDAGLYAMLAPKRWGGYEMHPVDCMKVWEAVGRIDSSAGWNLFMNQGVAVLAGWLSEEGVREVYASGIPTAAGALSPPARAVRADRGWRISGFAPFGSGCDNVRWLVLPCRAEDGTEFAAFFRREDGRVLDTWHTLGMRGTGSADFGAEDLFIPDHMTLKPGPLTNPAPGFEGPLQRIWPWSTINGESIISVAVTTNAVDAAVELCKNKTPAYQGVALKDQQLAQFLLGKAGSRVEAARDTLYRAFDFAYEDVIKSGKLMSIDAKLRVQLACSFAAEACAEAVRLVDDVVGTSSIRLNQPFERYFRDAHTLIHHASKSCPRYADAGKMMLGIETNWIFLTF